MQPRIVIVKDDSTANNSSSNIFSPESTCSPTCSTTTQRPQPDLPQHPEENVAMYNTPCLGPLLELEGLYRQVFAPPNGGSSPFRAAFGVSANTPLSQQQQQQQLTTTAPPPVLHLPRTLGEGFNSSSHSPLGAVAMAAASANRSLSSVTNDVLFNSSSFSPFELLLCRTRARDRLTYICGSYVPFLLCTDNFGMVEELRVKLGALNSLWDPGKITHAAAAIADLIDYLQHQIKGSLGGLEPLCWPVAEDIKKQTAKRTGSLKLHTPSAIANSLPMLVAIGVATWSVVLCAAAFLHLPFLPPLWARVTLAWCLVACSVICTAHVVLQQRWARQVLRRVFLSAESFHCDAKAIKPWRPCTDDMLISHDGASACSCTPEQLERSRQSTPEQDSVPTAPENPFSPPSTRTHKRKKLEAGAEAIPPVNEGCELASPTSNAQDPNEPLVVLTSPTYADTLSGDDSSQSVLLVATAGRNKPGRSVGADHPWFPSLSSAARLLLLCPESFCEREPLIVTAADEQRTVMHINKHMLALLGLLQHQPRFALSSPHNESYAAAEQQQQQQRFLRKPLLEVLHVSSLPTTATRSVSIRAINDNVATKDTGSSTSSSLETDTMVSLSVAPIFTSSCLDKKTGGYQVGYLLAPAAAASSPQQQQLQQAAAQHSPRSGGSSASPLLAPSRSLRFAASDREAAVAQKITRFRQQQLLSHINALQEAINANQTTPGPSPKGMCVASLVASLDSNPVFKQQQQQQEQQMRLVQFQTPPSTATSSNPFATSDSSNSFEGNTALVQSQLTNVMEAAEAMTPENLRAAAKGISVFSTTSAPHLHEWLSRQEGVRSVNIGMDCPRRVDVDLVSLEVILTQIVKDVGGEVTVNVTGPQQQQRKRQHRQQVPAQSSSVKQVASLTSIESSGNVTPIGNQPPFTSTAPTATSSTNVAERRESSPPLHNSATYIFSSSNSTDATKHTKGNEQCERVKNESDSSSVHYSLTPFRSAFSQPNISPSDTSPPPQLEALGSGAPRKDSNTSSLVASPKTSPRLSILSTGSNNFLSVAVATFTIIVICDRPPPEEFVLDATSHKSLMFCCGSVEYVSDTELRLHFPVSLARDLQLPAANTNTRSRSSLPQHDASPRTFLRGGIGRSAGFGSFNNFAVAVATTPSITSPLIPTTSTPLGALAPKGGLPMTNKRRSIQLPMSSFAQKRHWINCIIFEQDEHHMRKMTDVLWSSGVSVIATASLDNVVSLLRRFKYMINVLLLDADTKDNFAEVVHEYKDLADRMHLFYMSGFNRYPKESAAIQRLSKPVSESAILSRLLTLELKLASDQKGATFLNDTGRILSPNSMAEARSYQQHQQQQQQQSGAIPSWLKEDDIVLGEFLGSGACGEVYAAYMPCISAAFACKRIDLLDKTSEQIRLLEDEIRINSQLLHPNVVRCFFVRKEPPHHLHMYLELCDGGTVGDLVRGKSLDAELIFQITLQVCHALAYLHGQRITHGDLKPENLLVKGGEMKLADFGVSSKAQLGVYGVRGTLRFMAPEVALEERGISPASDIWSLGCMFCDLLTLPLDFRKDATLQGILMGLRNLPRNYRPELPDNVPPQVRDFLNRCLCRDPDKRATATELLASSLLTDDGAAETWIPWATGQLLLRGGVGGGAHDSASELMDDADLLSLTSRKAPALLSCASNSGPGSISEDPRNAGGVN